ncbi:MAG TPA: serine hydrolase domain-containing protein, partial [Thermoleophilaceae bacterium]
MPSARLKIAGLVTLAVATLVAVAVAANPAAGRAAPRAELQRAVDALAAAGAPGAVALVRDGDRTIRVAGGYGDLAKRTPMRARHRFRVGSSTKTFVAAVVLQLAGERKLALEDSVERWLPGLVPNG